MNWGAPEYFWLGLSVIPAVLALLWGERRRRRDLAALIPPEAPPSALLRFIRPALRGRRCSPSCCGCWPSPPRSGG